MHKNLKKATTILTFIVGAVFITFHSSAQRILPTVKFDLPDNNFSITYIGHATTLIHLDGVNILTDPNFSERVAWLFKRHAAPGIAFDNLPEINAIIISHEHSDHLDESTLCKFEKDIPVIISRGLGSEIKELNFQDVRELAWWEKTVIKGIEITAVPAEHDATASGYIIHGSKTTYFAGDTGIFPALRDIAKQFDIDVVLLPIGGYYPYFPGNLIPSVRNEVRRDHMAPDDIPYALEMLNYPIMIPIHWGTFKLSGESLEEPIKKLSEIERENNLGSKIRILQPGEVFVLDSLKESVGER
ncbi:MAG: MBL fold metallo-hydrolase [Candidatus Aminicenantia bacterium]